MRVNVTPVRTESRDLIGEVSAFGRCPLREVPL